MSSAEENKNKHLQENTSDSDVDPTDPFLNESDADPEYSPGDRKYSKRKTVPDFFHFRSTKQTKLDSCVYGTSSQESLASESETPTIDSRASTPQRFEVSEDNENLGTDSENKWRKHALFDGRFFSFVKIIGNNIEVKCQLCKPANIRIKGPSNSTSNFLKHLRTKHPGSLDQYNLYKLNKKKNTPNREIKSSFDDPGASYCGSGLKMKQATLFHSVKGNLKNDQKDFDKRLVKFVVETMSPTSIIEHDSFKNLFLSTNIVIMSRRTLVRKINEEYETCLKDIKENLNLTTYVCTTADIWSAKRRSFLGVTCHWLDGSLQRHSAALACRRFSGVHSFIRIAEMLEDIHIQFNLDLKKIVSTITDNGSNFVKAFRDYGIQLVTDMNATDETESESDSDSDDGENFAPSSIEDNFLENKKDIALPKHIRCASHTLNLLATTDFINVLNANTTLRSRHEKIMQKCTKLWTKAGRPKSAEIIQQVLGHTLSYPSITRWNSFFKSVSQILDIKDNLKELFEKLDLTKEAFKDSEIQYLEEYCTILKPIANTLDFLQGENNTYYGYVLPSILSLKVKLYKLQSEKEIKLLAVVLQKIRVSLTKRFESYFSLNTNSEEAIVAAATLPSIKLRWLSVLRETDPNVDIKAVQKVFITTAMKIISNREVRDSTTPEHKENISDFFDFNESTISPSTQSNVPAAESDINHSEVSLKNKVELEFLKFLNDNRQNLSMLEDYPIMKQIFVRFNTSLASSAPVERLFSFATYINTPRRHGLSDKLFEKLVVLKGNN